MGLGAVEDFSGFVEEKSQKHKYENENSPSEEKKTLMQDKKINYIFNGQSFTNIFVMQSEYDKLWLHAEKSKLNERKLFSIR